MQISDEVLRAVAALEQRLPDLRFEAPATLGRCARHRRPGAVALPRAARVRLRPIAMTLASTSWPACR